jgi:hypothetical protein
MTLAGGARCGSRAWRLVTVTPGRPGHQPAGTMTGARGASLEVPQGLAGLLPRLAFVSRSLAQVEPWDEILPMAESRGGTPRGERAAIRARRTPLGAVVGYASLGVLLPFFFFRPSWLKARIVRLPAPTAGILWRRSVRRAEKFSSRDDDSGADRIARTIPYVVIAGLDPAIHPALQHGPPGQARW